MNSESTNKGRWALRIGLVAVAVMLMGLAGCGDDDDDSNPTDGGTLVIGMSAASIPVPDTAPTEGYEGYRFVALQLYDGLVNWDPANGVDNVTTIKPGLAESWTVSDDNLTWTFNIRSGATFHDGTPVDAAALEFAFDRALDTEFEFYSQSVAAGLAGGFAARIQSYEATDDMTFEITTTVPFAWMLEKLAEVLIPSPTQVRALGEDFASDPVGSGPFMFESLATGQSLTMVKNPNYWGSVAHLDKVILRPMPEPSTRLAALRSGEVDWVEAPPPDARESLEDDGFQIFLKVYPHIWPWEFAFFSEGPETPIGNQLVRQALNYAIDRESLCEDLLSGACEPAFGYFYAGHPLFGDVTPYEYDPEKAKELLAEAGYPDGFEMTVLTSIGGSGQMFPDQMNEFIAQNLAEVGVDLTVEAREWNTLLTAFGSQDWGGAEAINISLPFMDPSQMIGPFGATGYASLFGYSNPELDELFAKASEEFDDDAQVQYMQDAHRLVLEDAPWLFIVHDLNMRAMAPHVKGFVANQSWFTDLTTVYIEQD